MLTPYSGVAVQFDQFSCSKNIPFLFFRVVQDSDYKKSNVNVRGIFGNFFCSYIHTNKQKKTVLELQPQRVHSCQIDKSCWFSENKGGPLALL